MRKLKLEDTAIDAEANEIVTELLSQISNK